MIFKWLRDTRYAPVSESVAADAPIFLPVEIVSPTRSEVARATLPASAMPNCLLEIEIADGHRLRVSGAYDPEALAQLIRGCGMIPVPMNAQVWLGETIVRH